jgi:hypothetical protein
MRSSRRAFPIRRRHGGREVSRRGRPFAFDAARSSARLAEIAAPRGRASGPSAADEVLAAPGALAEAVLGASVARQLGIRLGDQIEPTHGVDGAGTAHEHAQLWTVVGILQPTATPVDELVLINLDSFFRIPDHRGGIIPRAASPPSPRSCCFRSRACTRRCCSGN